MMNLGITECSYVQVTAGYGSAAPSRGLGKGSEGAGNTTGREGPENKTGRNRLNRDIAVRPFSMANNPFSCGNKLGFSADIIVQEMQAAVRVIASPSIPGESVKAAISRAARRSGLSFSQARRLWYGLWRDVPAHVVESVRIQASIQRAQPTANELQNEISAVHSMLAQIMAKLNGEPAA